MHVTFRHKSRPSARTHDEDCHALSIFQPGHVPVRLTVSSFQAAIMASDISAGDGSCGGIDGSNMPCPGDGAVDFRVPSLAACPLKMVVESLIINGYLCC